MREDEIVGARSTRGRNENFLHR